MMFLVLMVNHCVLVTGCHTYLVSFAAVLRARVLCHRTRERSRPI